MWRILLTIGLLCWSSEARITCRDNNNGEVDWFIMYKAAKNSQVKYSGLRYIYMDSTVMTASSPQTKLINHPNGVLANTLQPLFTPIRSMPPNFGFISYSDQAPGCNARKEFGHSKGVLMIDRTGTGVWLLHSTPQFPFKRDQNNFWPSSGERYAQTFFCVTFPYDQFIPIGKHLQYIRAFPFEHDIPQGFHKELQDAVNRVQKTPPNNLQKLMSGGLHVFHSIAKQVASATESGDLYATLAREFSSDVKVQTWGCQKERDASSCPARQYKVLNIDSVKTDIGEWGPKKDHSKWCVATENATPWICIADVNRARPQYSRRGGALCFLNRNVRLLFQHFIRSTEPCPRRRTATNTLPECDPDPDYD